MIALGSDDFNAAHDCIKYYAANATPKTDWLSSKLGWSKGRSLFSLSLYIDTEGAKHSHGPETSENARYECDGDFVEWETLLGEAAGQEA